ncbi:cytochrome d ubiquinol oxidase subunit II [Conexibacter sp. JD483]|uniref:cytochrome d ubiquinol oxidase subunit II n=1 Tax=unclassified Conexibacter TaxID=2627773 RepID=UPI0027273364|nr:MULTISPECIES: cytochrome d ubiquinol oxidase subunit II [unclassified Conexibacter]MDO8186955.1 cytochrome d ubiquinol oxidase subunit II [Conexibacter sp. CPCC 205706]MDO8200590.1 cytochrome d ubiquinol oxidase subunit II [Conexibacter sp. CPCC 205762]MDR9368832.1 cytochrome d ubiquinol oxidase subunit II [Conexibacter sp. JD483]
MDPTTLETIWFLLICILWIGYFVLEGFDFGVGLLLRAVGRDRAERRMLMHSIGPFWDGNEVWLLVAGGATFAAFPGWYASLFSGAYLALFVILVALIFRGVAFEFWGKHDTARWRGTWEWALILGSAVPALLWGVAWANIVRGLPLNAAHDMTGTFFDLLTPYTLLGGVVSLALFTLHGAIFLTLRLSDTDAPEAHARAEAIAKRVTPVALVAVVAFLGWTLAEQDGVEWFSALLAVGAAVLVGAVMALLSQGKFGLAFGVSAGAIALTFSALFADLFPNALPSTTSAANDLTLAAAASTPYTLKVMTVVAVLLVPVVLAYQAWTYWILRARLGKATFEEVRNPVDLVARMTGGTPGGGGPGAGGSLPGGAGGGS